MKKEITYWTTKNGTKINIDDMTIDHLRNTLKMIINANQRFQSFCPHNISDAIAFSDAEVELITKKSQYQFENEENYWK